MPNNELQRGLDSDELIEVLPDEREGDALQLEKQVKTEIAALEAQAAGFVVKAQAEIRGAGVEREIAEMKEVVAEAGVLKKTFLERLVEIMKDPAKAMKEYNEKKWEEELAIPDNPRVIKELQKIIDQVKALLKKVEYKKDAVSSKRKIYGSLRQATEICEKANIKDKEVWRESSEELNNLLTSQLVEAVNNKKSADALEVYAMMARPGFEGAGHLENRLVDLVVDEHFHFESAKSKEFSVQAFFEKRAAFEQASARVETVLGGKDRLLKHYHGIKNYIADRFYSSAERFLSDQPREIVDKLRNFSEAEQMYIVSAWKKDAPSMQTVMENEKAPDLLSVLIQFPHIGVPNKTDLPVVEAIATRFPAAERAMLAEKLKPCFDKAKKEFSWDALQGVLVMASWPESGQADFTTIPTEKLYALTATMIAHGEEAVKKLWTKDNVAKYSEEQWNERNVSNRHLIDFAKNLSTTLRKHLPTKSYSDQGLREQAGLLSAFYSVVQYVPKNLREQFFTVLEPSEWPIYGFIREQEDALNKPGVFENFIEYAGDCGGVAGLNFRDFAENAKYFTAERWSAVKRGHEIFKTAGLEQKVKNKLYIFEMAGGPEGEAGNDVVTKLLAGSELYVRRSEYSSSVSRCKRDNYEIQKLYIFSNFCRRELAEDTDLMLQFLNIGDDSKIISAFLSGELQNIDSQFPDMPIIEGDMIFLAERFKGLLEDEKNKGAENLARFKKLNRQQKEDFITLRDLPSDSYYNLPLLFSTVEAGLVLPIKRLAEAGIATKGNQFKFEELVRMSARPDCLGLFYYVESGYKTNQVIDKLIELHDAGLPNSFNLNKFYRDHYHSGGYGESTFATNLVEWEAAKLAEVARQGVAIKPDLTLADIVLFSNPEESVRDLVLRIREACVEGGGIINRYDPMPDEASVLRSELRLQEAQQIFGDDVISDEEKRILAMIEPVVWERIKTNTIWLKNCLENHFGYTAIATLSADILDEPLFWKIRLTAEILAKEDAVRQAVNVAKMLQSAGLNVSNVAGNHREDWNGIVQMSYDSPWLLEPQNLAFLKVVAGGDLENGLARFKDLTPVEFESVRDYAVVVDFESYKISYFLHDLREGKLMTFPEVEELRQLAPGKIDYEIIRLIQEQRQPGETVGQTVVRLQERKDEVRDGVYVSSEERRIRNWPEQRILATAMKTAPEFVGKILTCEDRSLDFYQKVGALPAEVLVNLEKIYLQQNRYNFKQADAELLMTMAAHRNILTVVSLAEARPGIFNNLHKSTPAKLQTFLDGLTPEVAAQFSALPSFVTLSGVDIVDFFEDPVMADKIVELATRLKEIFGEELKNATLSAYDLLIMDFETDLGNLKELKGNCFNKLDFKMVKALIEMADGSRLATLQRVLLLYSNETKIDLKVAMTQLEKLPVALRMDIIREKGAENFGWGILRYREQLVGLGFDQAEMARLTIDLFESGNCRGSGDKIDYPTALTLLDDPKQDEKQKFNRSMAIVSKFDGTQEELVELLTRDRGIVQNCLEQKQSAVIFELAVKKVFSPTDDQWVAMIDERLLEGDYVNLLKDKNLSETNQAAKDKVLTKEKIDLLESRLGVLAKEWRSHPEKTVDIFEKQILTGVFESKILVAIQEMMGDATLIADEPKLIERVNRMFVEMLTVFDPTLRRTFHDPQKLGRLRAGIVENLATYVKLAIEQKQTTKDTEQKIRKKLVDIKRAFESSDASESARRTIFLDMYNLQLCQDPSVAEAKGNASSFKKLVERDVREILIMSGSEQERKFLERVVEKTNDPEEKATAERYGALAKSVVVAADKRNRRMTAGLPENALTHGTSKEYLGLILEGGNFSGELLGSNAKTDQSGLLGVDLSQITAEEDENTFEKRYAKLSNGGYGDTLLVFGGYLDNMQNATRPPWNSGWIGEDHRLVRVGMPSTEITSIVLRNDGIADGIKKDVATKGFYIPLFDTKGAPLFSEEEFDTMRVFYCGLAKKGYSKTIIDDVYKFYQNPQGSEKHSIVMAKAFEVCRTQMAADQPTEDLVILVSFLRGNDLNTRDVEWYKQASYAEIMDIIRGSVGKKIRKKARDLVVAGADSRPRPLGETVREARQTKDVRRKDNVFIDNFFDKQLPFAGQQDEAPLYEKAMVDLLFDRATSGARLAEIAQTFSEQKKTLMKKLWTQAWEEILTDKQISDEQKNTWKSYREAIVPVLTGSAGRGEIVLGSDLDYLLMVDDESRPVENEDSFSEFINTVLATRMNALLEANGIKADAGLAKKDRKPYTKLSTLKQFKIDLQNNRQDEEPTTIVDTDPLFDRDEDRAVVEKSKQYLLVENPTAQLLESYIAKDLELGGEKYPSYTKRFEELYDSFASGNVLNKIKESLQRVITFKTYHLLFGAFSNERIPKTEAKNIPASTSGKIDFLTAHGILTTAEAATSKELLGITYKLRFLGEVYSDEAQKKEADKVYNVKFRVEDISYDERAHLFDLLKKFKSEVLYK